MKKCQNIGFYAIWKSFQRLRRSILVYFFFTLYLSCIRTFASHVGRSYGVNSFANFIVVIGAVVPVGGAVELQLIGPLRLVDDEAGVGAAAVAHHGVVGIISGCRMGGRTAYELNF